MTSVRLTQEIRKDIRNSLIKDPYKDKVLDHAKKASEFTYKVYRDLYTMKEFEYIATAPTGWLNTDNYIMIDFAGERAHLPFNGAGGRYNCHNQITDGWEGVEDREEIVPDGRGYRALKSYDADHEMTVIYRELQEAEKTLHEEIHQTMVEVSAILNNARTVKKLIEIWPDVEPHIPAVLVKAGTNLPAVQLEALNEKLGIGKAA